MLEVLFFLVAAFFFSHPYPEKCHFFGQSHQIFHVLLVLCTLAQIEAVVLDYESRREIYSSLQRDLAHDFSALFLATVTCSVLTAAYMAWRVKNKLGLKEENRGTGTERENRNRELGNGNGAGKPETGTGERERRPGKPEPGTGTEREKPEPGTGNRETGADREPGPGSPGMRRRRGDPAPAEPCGVWLDTAELKRGPAPPPSSGLKAPRWKRSPALPPQPGRRQSSIRSFLRPLAGEGDKENASPAERSGPPLPARLVKILPLPRLRGAREEPPGAGQGLRGTAQPWQTPLGAPGLPAQAQRQSKAPRGAGGGSWCCGCSRSPEKCWIFPGEAASAGREAQPWSRAASGTGSAGAEDTEPGPGVEDTKPGPGVEDTKPGPRVEDTKPGPGDSQGNRVIAHRPRASPPRASQPRGLRLELGWEPLFTQDSEGNRVIKHWE
uniref:membrane progestin receptor alpha n=1 Tax=Lonchura striata TaxID=40157 RepID=UPI0012939692|nr:membrane progestin receptor alpha [Lonchura striata domestica]